MVMVVVAEEVTIGQGSGEDRCGEERRGWVFLAFKKQQNRIGGWFKEFSYLVLQSGDIHVNTKIL